jgi:hypothetical protein
VGTGCLDDVKRCWIIARAGGTELVGIAGCQDVRTMFCAWRKSPGHSFSKIAGRVLSTELIIGLLPAVAERSVGDFCGIRSISQVGLGITEEGDVDLAVAVYFIFYNHHRVEKGRFGSQHSHGPT